MDFINVPMGYLLKWLAQICGGNFAMAVFLFTVLVNVAILPLTIKSQKSTAKQSMLKPKLDALKKKYGDDKVKYSQAMQELYQRENVSMAGGCLPMIIRLIFMMAVYYVVINPLQYLGGVDKETINKALKALIESTGTKALRAIDLVKPVALGEVKGIDSDVLSHINFNFFGIDLTQKPHFTFNFSEAEIIWVIPFLAFAAAMLTSIVTLIMQKKSNPDQPNMAGMMLTMPLMSLIIGFTVPGAVGFYWACSSLISGALQVLTQIWFSPAKLVANQQMQFALKRNQDELKIKNRTAK